MDEHLIKAPKYQHCHKWGFLWTRDVTGQHEAKYLEWIQTTIHISYSVTGILDPGWYWICWLSWLCVTSAMGVSATLYRYGKYFLVVQENIPHIYICSSRYFFAYSMYSITANSTYSMMRGQKNYTLPLILGRQSRSTGKKVGKCRVPFANLFFLLQNNCKWPP